MLAYPRVDLVVGPLASWRLGHGRSVRRAARGTGVDRDRSASQTLDHCPGAQPGRGLVAGLGTSRQIGAPQTAHCLRASCGPESEMNEVFSAGSFGAQWISQPLISDRASGDFGGFALESQGGRPAIPWAPAVTFRTAGAFFAHACLPSCSIRLRLSRPNAPVRPLAMTASITRMLATASSIGVGTGVSSSTAWANRSPWIVY